MRVPLVSHSRADLFRELVALALGDADEARVRGVVAAVEAREAQVSTAMGGALAVPHGRTDLVPDLRLAAGIVRDLPDYLGPDGEPVGVAILVLTPEQEMGKHIKVLAHIARLMHDPSHRSAILASSTPEEFLAVVRRSETP